MSANIQGDNARHVNGGFGIRLPPISFLSGAPNSQPLAQSMENRQPQEPHELRLGNNGIFFSLQNGNGGDKPSVSLPEPQALNIIPQPKLDSLSGHDMSINGNRILSENAMSVDGLDERKAISGTQHHHHHHHHQNPHHHHHHHHRRYHHNHQPHADVLPDSDGNGSAAMGQFKTGNSAERRASLRVTKLAEARLDHKKRQKKKAYRRIYQQLDQKFPTRRHLGTLMYNPTTTWETLQFEQLNGLLEHDRHRFTSIREEYLSRKAQNADAEQQKYIPIIPPLSGAYINNFLEVKIPYKHIKEFLASVSQGSAQYKRELWGGRAGMYTDDSDLLYVLCHLGLFDGKLDLSECNSTWTSTDLTRPASTQKDADGIELLDLSVTLLLLPGLEQYRGFYRNGLNSRSWVDRPAHSGLSFAVYNIKWETFLLSTGERALSKWARLEYIEDKIASARIRSQKNGWTFDPMLLRGLKQKTAEDD